MKINSKSFFNLIKRLKNKGLTQRKIGGLFNIKESLMSQYISGTKPIGQSVLYKMFFILDKEKIHGVDFMINYYTEMNNIFNAKLNRK